MNYLTYLKIITKYGLSRLINPIYPDISRAKEANRLGQLRRFIKEIKTGDLVALPLKLQSAIVIGEIRSDSQYEETAGRLLCS